MSKLSPTPDERAIYTHIGSRIQEERKSLGFSQMDLAQEVGLARVSISNIEVGRYCTSISMLYKIARALGISVMALLPGEEFHLD